MSFAFEWPVFSDAFYEDAREMLAQALNKGTKPPIIADRIEVKELHMGTVPPELEILEIGDLTTDRFRGIFRLTYAGDAYIVLQTKVQANPLNVPRPSLDILGAPRILFAAAPLVVPMTLRLSALSLRAIIVLVVSRQKGITLVFKNDPLESVNVSSSFDGVESVAGYIQREIEGQLREAFRSDLPGVIHRLSQKWLSGEVKANGSENGGGSATTGQNRGPQPTFAKDAKIKTRTSYVPRDEEETGDPTPRRRDRGFVSQMHGGTSIGEDSMSISDLGTSFSTTAGSDARDRRRSISERRHHPSHPPLSSTQMRGDPLQSVPESIESYDPTYGLRPDAIPLNAGFGEYERLLRAGLSGNGLGDILSVDDDSEDGQRRRRGMDDSFDVIDLRDLVESDEEYSLPRWGDSASNSHARPRYGYDSPSDSRISPSMETIPAVGGGTITRPRIFFTQSQMRTRTVSTGSLSAHGSPSTATAASVGTRRDVAGSSSNLAAGGRRTTGSSYGLSPLDGRHEYISGLTATRSSGTSTPPRFPLPQYGYGTGSRPAPSKGLDTSSSMTRGTSAPQRTQYRQPLSPSRLSSSNSTSPGNTRRSSSTLFPSNHPSSYSSPPSSTPSPIRGEDEPTHHPYPTPRDPHGDSNPTAALDLLSRSPSSMLLYDEEEVASRQPITLSPSRNDSCAHLASLTISNQTLSPFTRSHEHFTARSSPYVISQQNLGAAAGVAAGSVGGGAGFTSSLRPPWMEGTSIKVNRKRVHRIGNAKVGRESTKMPLESNPTSPDSMGPAENRGAGGGGGGGEGGGQRSKIAPSEMSEYFPQALRREEGRGSRSGRY